MVFTAMLYPAFLWDPEYSFAGEPPPGLGMLAAVFCMSLSALSQTAVNLTELAPASGYTISIVVMVHFVGARPPPPPGGCLCRLCRVVVTPEKLSKTCLLLHRSSDGHLAGFSWNDSCLLGIFLEDYIEKSNKIVHHYCTVCMTLLLAVRYIDDASVRSIPGSVRKESPRMSLASSIV